MPEPEKEKYKMVLENSIILRSINIKERWGNDKRHISHIEGISTG
jgi:hypothetical protein